MATYRPLYINLPEGIPAEFDPAVDDMVLAKYTATGLLGVGFDGGGNRAVNFGAPTAAGDLANKSYVDAFLQGLNLKGTVTALADTNVATLSGLPTVDGVTLTAGQKVLLTAQTTASQNGPWVVGAGAWVRPPNFANGSSAASSFWFVDKGTVHDNQPWAIINDAGSDIVGTDALTLQQINGLSQVINGNGLAKSGNTLSISLATNSALQFTSGALDHLLNAGGGLLKDASGLAIKINSSPATLAADGSGLRAVGLPSLFKINDVATTSAVSAAALNTLTGGAASNADNLHTHAAVTSSGSVVGYYTNGGSSLSPGDPVYWSSTVNTLGRADPSTDATGARIFGVALAAAAPGATQVPVLRVGVAQNVLSGATAGAPQYLAPGGGLANSVSGLASGSRIVRVGWAKNATDLEVNVALGLRKS